MIMAVYRWSARVRRSRALGRLAGEFLVAVLLVEGCWAQAPGSYSIEPQSSHIEIHLFRGGLLGGFGDNHVVVLGTFSGTAQASAGSPWRVHVLGESGSLRVVDPGASASTRQQVQQTMLGATVLDAGRYKTIELQSRSQAPGETDRSWRMLADLTLHGVTRQEEFPLSWEQEGDRLQVRGSRKLRLRDFGIDPPRVAMGAIRVRNEFELVYDITLRKQ
jgi:polyisoprenoid-binding protein YceI